MMGRFKWSFYAVALAVGLFGCDGREEGSENLQSPNRLAARLAELDLDSVFVNPTADKLLNAAGTETEWSACNDSGAWRRMDRASRFDAVLLAGSPVEYQGLLAHLMVSPDFRLEMVDPWGVLFVRGLPDKIRLPTSDDIQAAYPDDFAEALSRLALVSDALGRRREAKAFMDAAVESDGQSAAVRTRQAILLLQRGDTRDAVDASAEALKLDPEYPAALEANSLALAAIGRVDEAWGQAERLLDVADPEDVNVLYFHARIANAARAYARETESLQKAIEILQREGLSTTQFHVYLGQALAKQGFAGLALEQLELALASGELDAGRQADVETAAQTLRKRAGRETPNAEN